MPLASTQYVLLYHYATDREIEKDMDSVCVERDIESVFVKTHRVSVSVCREKERVCVES